MRNTLGKIFREPKRRARLLRLIAGSRLLRAFYVFVADALDRELEAMLTGRARHIEAHAESGVQGQRYVLRRNTHRLEKGLLMRPRRPVFAEEYITRTVECYADIVNRAVDGDEGDTKLLAWSGDVLQSYFDVVSLGLSERIDRCRRQFHEINKRSVIALPTVSSEPTGEKTPFVRDETPLGVSTADLLRLAERRRSCRWYRPEPIDREVIDRAMKIASYSPTACNRQPFHFRIFDEPALAQKIGSIPGGTTGFAQNFPCLAVIVGELEAFEFDRDRHIPYIDASLAAMAFQFALEVEGVGSCCINWPDVPSRESEMAEALSLRPDERVIMCLSFGYPDPTGMVPFSQKKSLDEIRSYNRTK